MRYQFANQNKEKNIQWKGDKASYSAIHHWVNTNFGRIMSCEDCGNTSLKRYEWANISGEYKRERSDWKRLCRKCHNKLDKPFNYKRNKNVSKAVKLWWQQRKQYA